MNEMVERIARLICKEDPDSIDARTADDGDRYPAGKPHWMHDIFVARKIIAAMREPTEAMLIPAHLGRP